MPASITKISVLIPTRNRAASLQALLASLEAAQCPEGVSVEIVAINNGSADATAAMLARESAAERRYSLRVLDQPTAGKSNALNLALVNCDGDLLLIVDDDVSVDSLCLVKHIEAHRQTEFAAVQGKILPGRDPEGRSADLNRLREYNIPYIDYGNKILAIRGLTGTNMSFQRCVKDAVGLFDVRLGPGAAGFSEDTEFSRRIRRAGFKIGYTPDAIVYHELDPSRYGSAYNRQVEYRKGASRSIYRQDSILFRVLPNLFANCFRYGLYKALQLTQKAYKTEGRILKCWGYLMGKFQQRFKLGKIV